MAPLLAAAMDAYKSSKHGKEIVVNLKKKLDEKIQERELEDPDNKELFSREEQIEMAIECFGERKCLEVRGLGRSVQRSGRKRARRSYDIAAQEFVDTIKKADERVQKAEERMKEMREETALAIAEAQRAKEAAASAIEDSKKAAEN